MFEAYGLDRARIGDEDAEDEHQNAALDLALQHFLIAAYGAWLFNPNRNVMFLGGTALRITRFGQWYRISVDLDFNCPKSQEEHFWVRLNGLSSGPFTFYPYRTAGGNGRLRIVSHLFPVDEVYVVHLDLSQNSRVMRPELSRMLPMPCDYTYQQPQGDWLPVMTRLENAAGKLCRWYRRPLIRDLHDLAMLAPYLLAHVHELAEITVWTSTLRRGRDALVSGRPDEDPTFPVLGPRLGEPSEDGERFVLQDLFYVPEKTSDQKRALVDEWLGTVLEVTDALEAAICADERLLIVARRDEGSEGLCDDLENELRTRYDTHDSVYREHRSHR